MKRLTDHEWDDYNEPGCQDCSAYAYDCCRVDNAISYCHRRLIYNRLAAYEDAGLDPEEIEAMKLGCMGKAIAEITAFDGVSVARMSELSEADKDGRCVVLPCKVGDTVYLVLPKCRASRIPLAECNFFECDDCPRNKREIFEQKATTEMLSMMLFEKYNTLYVFGKTVFLTRAEAEAALAQKPI